MPTSVVTGGAGFLGSHLTDRLLHEGHQVLAIDNLITGNERNLDALRGNSKFRFVRHDVTQFISVEGPVDTVFHFASPASPIDYLELPIQTLKVGSLGTHNALGLAKAKGAKFLLASTSECYGDPLIHPQKEDYWGNVNPIGPRGVYDEAKRFAEAMTMAYHRYHKVDTKIVRIFNTYGPRMRLRDGRVVPAFIGQALKGEPLTVFGDGKQTRSFCYVSDLIDGIFRLSRSDFHEPVNLGNPLELTILEFAERIRRLTGTKSEIVRKPLPVDDPKQRQPDITRARQLLGWEPRVALEDGLRETIRWFQANLDSPEKKMSLGHPLLAVIFLAGLTPGLAAQEPKNRTATKEEEGRYRSALLFANVIELIRDEYLDPEKTDYDQMTHAALRGLLSSLDPHSQFLDPENYTMIRTETEGQFGGLGISVGMVENQLTVNVPIQGGPAFRAGLMPGDRILKIDGQGTQKLTLAEAIRKLRGRPGAPVTLTLFRPSEIRTLEVPLVREMIQVPTLTDVGLLPAIRTGGEKIGYLRITQFGEKTAGEFDQAIDRLEREGASALVLDLRDNPGGLVDAAVDLVSRFVSPGTLVVATEGRKAAAGRFEYLAKPASRKVRWPTVVLVNGNTASAAEIVAGALQDLGRAIVVGELTFGKGSVQTVQPVEAAVAPSVAVRLTTAHYTTPSRRKIHGVGIDPDITARMTLAEEKALYESRSPGLRKSGEAAPTVVDEPLDRAVDVLRGWKVFARRTAAAR